MSRQNEELARALVQAWNEGDEAFIREGVHSDVEVVSNLGGDMDGTFVGQVAGEQFLGRFWSSFEDFQTRMEDLVAVGDSVVFAGHQVGRGKASGVQVEMVMWQVLTF